MPNHNLLPCYRLYFALFGFYRVWQADTKDVDTTKYSANPSSHWLIGLANSAGLSNCEFLSKLWIFVKIVIFCQNCDFWWKLKFLDKIVIFGQKCDFLSKLWLCCQNCEFLSNCECLSKLWIFVKIGRFCQNFAFWSKLGKKKIEKKK